MFRDYVFSMRGNAVVIAKNYCEPFVIDEEELRDSIKLVRGDRASYATYEAWHCQLAMREEALQFLIAHLDQFNGAFTAEEISAG